MTGAIVGLAVWLVTPPTLGASVCALLAWCAGALTYLLLAWVMMARATVDHMKALARTEDDGAAGVLLLTVAAAVASLLAIVAELYGLDGASTLNVGLRLGLAGLTFTVSWLLVHTAFALHYAHAYWATPHRAEGPALAFAGTPAPAYTDFLYFASVIGMTSQTSDVTVCNTRMRRLVMAHAGVAFVFNTLLLALAVNTAAGLLH